MCTALTVGKGACLVVPDILDIGFWQELYLRDVLQFLYHPHSSLKVSTIGVDPLLLANTGNQAGSDTFQMLPIAAMLDRATGIGMRL